MSAEFLDDRDKKVLEIEARRRLYRIVRDFAGCHFREIERISSLPTGTVKYHLGYLSKFGLIKPVKKDNALRYFPRGLASEHTRLLGLLRQKSVRDILLFILAHPGCRHGQLVESTGLSPSTVSWHLKKLEESRIVASAKTGRESSLTLLIDKHEVIKLLVTYKESFLDSLVDRVLEMWEP